MTFLFSWLSNPIWFVRTFVASTVLVLLLSFFSYRQIRGQLGFASPTDVMYTAPETECVPKPVFDPVNRNREHLEDVCQVKPKKVREKVQEKVSGKKNLKKTASRPTRPSTHRSLNTRDQITRERALQQKAAQQAAREETAAEPVVTSHIITHNGKVRFVADHETVADETIESPTKIVASKKPPKQRISRNRTSYHGSFSLPIKRSQFWMSSPFGPRRRANGRRGFHKGVDMAAVRGTPVMAAGDGVVVFAANGGPYGNLVIIEHDERCRTWYAHLSAIKTHVGAQVEVGKVVGLVGATGYVRKRRGGSGDHLHFGMYIDGRAVNPVHYLN